MSDEMREVTPEEDRLLNKALMRSVTIVSDTPRDCEHGQLARSCEICELKRELAAVTAERDALRSSDDGNGPAWCATCGGLMQAVRPGKHQCVACEHYDHLRTKLHDAEAERIHANLMRERLTECLALAEAMACSHNADGDYVSLSEAMAAYRAWRAKR